MISRILSWLLSLFNTKMNLTENTFNGTNESNSDVPLQAPTIAVVPLAPASANKEPYAILTRRTGDGKETLGDLLACNNGTMHVSTLELGWHDNKTDISCIPKGTYKASVQPFHETRMYELQDVPGRDAIFLHSGNFASGKTVDTLGCILLGSSFSDINKDGAMDVINSDITVKGFMQFMNNKPFTLTIK